MTHEKQTNHRRKKNYKNIRYEKDKKRNKVFKKSLKDEWSVSALQSTLFSV